MSRRRTIVLCPFLLAAMVVRGWRSGAGQPAARSAAVSLLRENGTKPEAGRAEVSGGAVCGCAAPVGAGHPPPKAGASPAVRLTWSGLEKWEGFSAFAGGGAGEVLHG